MLYRYKDLISKGLSDYKIKKLLKDKTIISVEDKLYSDNFNYDLLDIVCTSYPMTVVTLNSALFEYRLIKNKPLAVYIATKQKARKILMDSVNQTFMSDHLLNIGIAHSKRNGNIINIFDIERLLIEIIRYRHLMDYKIFNEAIESYLKIKNLINIKKIYSYLELIGDTNLTNKVNKFIRKNNFN